MTVRQPDLFAFISMRMSREDIYYLNNQERAVDAYISVW